MRWSDPLADQGPHTSGGLVMENTPLIQGGSPKIAKLVYSSNNYGLWYL